MSTSRQPDALFSESELERAGKIRPARVTAAEAPEPLSDAGYYGIPFLKRPTWRWHIASYFFFGGLSAGCSLLASLAELSGRRELRRLRLSASELAFITLLPCPALLILDLGRPARFYHMLRVWKPSSPMNLGSWLLTAHSLAAAPIFLHAAGADGKLGPLSPAARIIPSRALHVAGLPFAFGMSGYGGTLLAGTSNPAWSESRWLSTVFVAGAFGSAVCALQLEMALRNFEQPAVERALERIGLAARLIETAAIAAHLVQSGRAARSLRRGIRALQLAGGVGLLFAGSALMPLPGRNAAGDRERPGHRRAGGSRRSGRITAALLGLAGAFLIRWAIVYGGRDAADDIAAAHSAAKARPAGVE
jgi:formate-dependent nitrite reductase membrane component NrfD